MFPLRFSCFALILTALMVLSPNPAPAMYMPIDFGTLVQRADVIVTGTILRVDQDTFEFGIGEELRGAVSAGETVSVFRFQDWRCAQRWTPYQPGQTLVLFLQRGGLPPRGRSVTPSTLSILGNGGEGEMAVIGPHVLLSSARLAHEKPHQFEVFGGKQSGYRIPAPAFADSIRNYADMRSTVHSLVRHARPQDHAQAEALQDRILASPEIRNYAGRSGAHSALVASVFHETVSAFRAVENVRRLPTWFPQDVQKLMTDCLGPLPDQAPASAVASTVYNESLNVQMTENSGGIRLNFPAYPYQAAFSPDGSRLAVSAETAYVEPSRNHGVPLAGKSVITIRRIPGLEEELRLDPQGQSFAFLSFSPDGSLMGAESGSAVMLWNTTDWKPRKLTASSRVRCGAFSPDGVHLAAGCEDGTLTIWKCRTGEIVTSASAHAFQVTSICYSPDGREVATGGDDGTIRIWEPSSGKLKKTIRPAGGQYQVVQLTYSPAGGRLAVTLRDHSLRLLDLDSGAERQVTGTFMPLHAVYSPDGRLLAVGSATGVVDLLDADTGNIIPAGPLKWSHGDTVSSITFSPDGQTVVSVASDKTVRFWHRALPAR